MPRLVLSDFSGGLNLRDSLHELKPNETADATNFTLDTRGAVRRRNGSVNVAALPGVSGKRAFIFYSEALNLWLCAREKAGTPNTVNIYSRPGDLSGSWTDKGALSVSLSTIVSFVDWPGTTPLVVVSSGAIATGAFTGNVSTFDGTTLTNRSVVIGGYGLAVWQNRVWMLGYPSNDTNGNLARLFACKVGDPTVWAAPDLTTVDIRDKDASRLTGLGIAGGALVVFKRRSAYRVTDSATGAYSTIDASAGAQGPLAVVSLRGRLYTWGADSLYEWDGVGPGRRVGDKMRPKFATDAALVDGVPALCCGVLEDRLLFAYPATKGGANVSLLEHDPEHGWLMVSALFSGTTPVSSFSSKDGVLYGALSSSDAIYSIMNGTAGQDDALALFSRYSTPWITPAGGRLCRLHRLDIQGLAEFGATNNVSLTVFKNGNTDLGDDYDLTGLLRAPSSTAAEVMAPLRALGHSASFMFLFQSFGAAGGFRLDELALDYDQIER